MPLEDRLRKYFRKSEEFLRKSFGGLITLLVNELFEFDSDRLEPAERLLLRDGVPVPLEPKVFETLLVLVRHGGRMVTRTS